MINHARTLLLNCAPLNGLGSEYISPEYRPKKLSPGLTAIWRILFGHDLSVVAKNYRARQLMTILHSTELEKYVYALDPRVTYWPTTDTDCFCKEPNELIPLSRLVQEVERIVDNKGFELFLYSNRERTEQFERYWYDYKQNAYRLGGLVLALIYRIEDLDEVEGC